MASKNNSNSGGGGILLPMLTVLFVGLKLTGYISWSWWWVLSPVWIPVSFFILIGLILVAIGGLND